MADTTKPPALSARGLTKSYDGKRVVDDLDLDVRPGTVLGLLGPNGAGKTTTLRMLYGYIDAEAGTIAYDGRDFAEHRTAIKRTIGVCTQEDTLDGDFDVTLNLKVYAGYFRPKVEQLDARVEELIAAFDLGEHRTKTPVQLSGGYRRRLMIARSIIHRPHVLFLDEPTTGLDPRARVDLWQLISDLRDDGMAVVLTTHYMDEAERLSDELVVMSRGKAVARGHAADILGAVVGEHILVLPPGAPERAEVETWAASRGVAPSTVLGELHLPLRAAGLAAFSETFPDARFTVRNPNLDDLFLKLAGEQEAA